MESEKLDLLAERVTQAVDRLSRLQQENGESRGRIGQLERELEELRAKESGSEELQHRLLQQEEEIRRLSDENGALRSDLSDRDLRLNLISERLEQVLGAIDALGEGDEEVPEDWAEGELPEEEGETEHQTMEFDIDSIEKGDDQRSEEGFRFE